MQSISGTLRGSTPINAAMVKDGFAWWYRKYAPDNSELARLEADARDTLTLEEAARRLGVSLRTVQRRVKDGDLSTIERDGARLVCLASDATEAATRDTTRRDSDATD